MGTTPQPPFFGQLKYKANAVGLVDEGEGLRQSSL